jgi:hypothetical protein
MTDWPLIVFTVCACLAATYGCLRLGVWIVMWRFKP